MSTTIHVVPDLLESVDRRASELGLSRNSYICKALERALEEEAGWSPRFRQELAAERDDAEGRQTLAEMAEIIASSRTRKPPPEVKLGQRFSDALSLASRMHADQIRKRSEDEGDSPGIPYLAHLISVAALVLEHGGDEDEAIAALLHDGPEDQGGQEVLDEIRRQFGSRVADIVEGCSDTLVADPEDKPEWRVRKEQYLDHLRHTTSPSVLLVSMADKNHNLRSILNTDRSGRESGNDLPASERGPSGTTGSRMRSGWYLSSTYPKWVVPIHLSTPMHLPSSTYPAPIQQRCGLKIGRDRP